MALITRPFSFTPGTTIVSAQVNSNETTLYNDYNGNITGDNIQAIAEAKITFSATGHAHSGSGGGAPIQLVEGSAIASAATITIPTDGNSFQVTGSTGITAINSRSAGVFAILRFAAACLLTHNAVSLILQDGYSVAMQAGDVICLKSEGAGNWRELWRMKGARSGAYRCLGVVGANNAGTPNTKFDLAADVIHFRGGTVKTAVSVTNDITVDNTGANGRDQAGAFGASTWIHLYFVLKSDGTVVSRSSTAVHTTGPTLPSGEIDWAYAGAVYYEATPLLQTTYWRGARASIVPVAVRASAAGTGAEQSYSLAAGRMPPNAARAVIRLRTNAAGNTPGDIRAASGGASVMTLNEAGLGAENNSVTDAIPAVGQTIYFIGSASSTFSIWALGYVMPNGDA